MNKIPDEIYSDACGDIFTFEEIENRLKTYGTWARELYDDLYILDSDMSLASRGYSIVMSIDFHEIFAYCFPFSDLIRQDVNLIRDYDKRKDFLSSQMSRQILFERSLIKFYDTQTPMLLLTPHESELNDSMKRITKSAKSYLGGNAAEAKTELVKFLLNRVKIDQLAYSIPSKSINDLLKMFNEFAPDLLFLFCPFTSIGINECKRMLLDDTIIVPINKIDEYAKFAHQSEETDYSDFVEIAKSSRKRKKGAIFDDKALQNDRDGLALQMIVDLNKEFAKEKRLFILVSSAPHMKNLTTTKELVQPIEGVDFKYIREVNTYYTYILELASLINSKGNTTSIKDIEPEEIQRKVKRDLKKVKAFIDADDSFWKLKEVKGRNPDLSNVLADLNIKLGEIIRLNEELENYELTVIARDFLPDRVAVPIDFKSFLSDITVTFEEVKKSIDNREFTYSIMKKCEMLDLKRSYSAKTAELSIIPYLTKRQSGDIILIARLPFHIQIVDPEARRLIRSLEVDSKNARVEYIKNGVIPWEIETRVSDGLIELAQRANAIETDEKHVLWEIILLALNQINRVAKWHNAFKGEMQQETLLNSNYLYCISLFLLAKSSHKRDFPMQQQVEKTQYHDEIFRIGSQSGHNSNILFNYLKSLILINLFEQDFDVDVIVLSGRNYTREDMVSILRREMYPKINKLETSFKMAITNNLCYAINLQINSKDDVNKYEADILFAKSQMTEMNDQYRKDSKYWRYHHSDTLGYIYMQLARHYQPERRIENATTAITFFNDALSLMNHDIYKVRKKVELSIRECEALQNFAKAESGNSGFRKHAEIALRIFRELQKYPVTKGRHESSIEIMIQRCKHILEINE